jgi:hypothetical protein
MSLYLHEWGIHALYFDTDGVGVAEVRFVRDPAAI